MRPPAVRHRRPGAVAASLLGAALVAAGLALVPAWGSGAVSSAGSGDVTETPLVVPVGPEPSGEPVTLDVSVFVTGEGGRRPAVVLAHGFGGSKADVAGNARRLAADGYVALTYTARGFDGSGGRIHLNSPDFEVADASALLDLLAERADVALDAPGDPRVGVAGGSYGGAVALLTAGHDDRVDAIVPMLTWSDLSRSLFPQGAQAEDDAGAPPQTPAASRPAGDAGVFKQRWASLFFSAGRRGGDVRCGRFDPEVCAEYAAAATSGRPSPRLLELLRASSPASVLERISAPTLLVQGQTDSLFPLEEADANARGIDAAGTPVAVWWVAGGHDSGDVEGVTPGMDQGAVAGGWLDHHLRGAGPDPGTGFEFSLPPDPSRPDEDPVRVRGAGYPGLGGEEFPVGVTLPLTGAAQDVASPPGGEPAALTNLPGAGAALAAATALPGAAYSLAVLPGAAAVFDSEPVERTLTVVGAPRVRLSVTSTAPDATLFASVWVGRPDGSATLPRRLVSPVRLEGLQPGVAREVDVLLPASAYQVQPGDRLRVVVSSTDQAYAVPTDGRAYRVALAGSSALEVPASDSARVREARSGSGVPSLLVAGVAVLTAAALGFAAVRTLRHRGRARQRLGDDLDGAPLVVDGLTKSYASGLRAVDGATWRAERGQVVGLLGPNGAGKTTTMRMLVGLIGADAGSIHVLGERVSAGAPVLSRVGALIEGPGFLPHLSGRDNLLAYWAATGRPAPEAGIAEALEVAGLGSAVDRPVRSYSQGMRQRLGIAQAMLGRPELLLLDEPTNGLDPPQIRAMRSVLADYAASGRTVVVSSHLLAEVEQTCSHVVVMNRGKVVLSGPVADLVDSADTTVITLQDGDDPAAAATLLACVDGVTEVDVDDDGRLRVVGTAARPVLVRALVRGGHDVSAVDGRRHLEDVFMALVGEGSAAPAAATVGG